MIRDMVGELFYFCNYLYKVLISRGKKRNLIYSIFKDF